MSVSPYDSTTDMNIAQSISQIFMKLGMNIMPAIFLSPPTHHLTKVLYPAFWFYWF